MRIKNNPISVGSQINTLKDTENAGSVTVFVSRLVFGISLSEIVM